MVAGSRALKAFAVLLALVVAGCTAPAYEPPAPRPVAKIAPPPAAPPVTGTAVVTPAPEPEPLPPPEPIPVPVPPPSSGATAALLQQSRQQSAAGNDELAISSLERALRINPRDSELWLELGELKLRQGDYAQAESMGRRALAVAGNDPSQRGRCEALIAAAKRR